MKYSLVIAGFVCLLAASTLKAGDRFEDKGYHGFVWRLDIGAATIKAGSFPSYGLVADKWKSSFAGTIAIGLRIGRNALLMYEELTYIFTIKDDDWLLDGGDLSLSYYLTKAIFVNGGPFFGRLSYGMNLPGPFGERIQAAGVGVEGSAGLDLPISSRWSILPNIRFVYVNFDDFESKVLAFSIGIAFLP